MKKKLLLYYINISLCTVLIVSSCLFVYPHTAAGEFIDTVDSWAQMDIAQMKAIGIIDGYSDGLFHPVNNITRAEFSKLIIEALGKGEEAVDLSNTNPPFADLGKGYWANAYIRLGQEMGLLNGRGTMFVPEDYISREEAACIISRALDSNFNSKEEIPLFSDLGDISKWAESSVSYACARELMDGFPDGSFRPGDFLTREQSVVILRRIMDEKGLLYSFNGVLEDSDENTVTILIKGNEQTFKLSSDSQFFNREKAVVSLKDFYNTRVNFNVNKKGEVIFAALTYEDRYLDLNITQLDDSPRTIPEQEVQYLSLSSLTQQEDEIQPWSRNILGESLEIAREAAGINKLYEEKSLSGQGTVIAMIDSGIDPLNKDLQRTGMDMRKIIDWANFTSEGRVRIDRTVTAEVGKNTISTNKGRVILPTTVNSSSGQYRYGYWQEEWISYAHEFDFTGNGLKNDSIMVLLVDSEEAGVYDQVFVDSNSNLSLLDEIPLKVFRDNKHSYASFPITDDLPRGYPFILCDIAGDGSEVIFGYDSVGHGTHVAGIAAANGQVKGVAPDTKLLALKVADSAGIARLDDTLEAVEYAVKKGADVINMSLGYYEEDEEKLRDFRKRINEIAENTLICTATGNAGPGLATLSAPGDVDNVLSVGAYISPDMWENDYGWRTETDGLWYFNAVGPTPEGTCKPDLLAPGSAVSTYPVWTGNYYLLNEGTSMATPFVSGTAALLMQDMLEKGQGYNSLMIKDALLEGAKERENFLLIEQGHGVLNAYNSWQELQNEKNLPAMDKLEISSDLYDKDQGIYARNILPGITELEVKNTGNNESLINWESQAEWIDIDRDISYIPSHSSRELEITYDLPVKPGIYCGKIKGIIEDGAGRSIEIMNTLVIPEKWDKKGRFLAYNTLPAGQIKRYYLDIPRETEVMELNLKILGNINRLQGRSRVHLFDPTGNLYTVSEYAGVAPDGMENKREINLLVNNLIPGNWEIVVYSSATLSHYNLESTDYVLEARLKGKKIKSVYIESEFIIGCGHLKNDTDVDTIILNILELESKKPYNGKLMINDRLYFVKNGQVKVQSEIKRQAVDLIIRKVS